MRMKTPFVCVRCGYETFHKSSMFNHFFKKKKNCPQTLNVIELTDDIKQYILDNRIYRMPSSNPTQVINQTINNYNTMNNFIAGMDAVDKLSKYLDHKNIKPVDFEQSIDERYTKIAEKLDNDCFKYGYELKKNDFLELINENSELRNEQLEAFNLMYDFKGNKLKIYDNGEWDTSLVPQGIQHVITVIKDYLLNSYEAFLVRTMFKTSSVITRQQQQELLEEYYEFLCCFDILPFVKDVTDADLMGNDSNEYNISDQCYAIYKRIKNEISNSKVNKVRKEVLDILKRNTMKNIEEVNKRIFELFNMDSEFKTKILQSLGSPLAS